jgi:hypothetical protein
MFRPVGELPSSVYWRRRLVLVGGLVLLVVLTVYVLLPGGGDSPSAASGPLTSSSAARPSAPSTSGGSTAAGPAGSTSAGTTTSSAASAPAAAPTPASAAASPAACAASQLQISAQLAAPGYKVGDQPTLYLQVVNAGPAPCVQDLADPQVELRVFNGQSRLWGSHDCLVQPGTDLKTLDVNVPARVGVQWSGLTSQPGCATGTRQRVGAGSYTLYALLAGAQGTPATFTIS